MTISRTYTVTHEELTSLLAHFTAWLYLHGAESNEHNYLARMATVYLHDLRHGTEGARLLPALGSADAAFVRRLREEATGDY